MTARVLGLVVVCTALFAWPDARALKGDAEQPINVRARAVEANEKTGVSVYRGNVVLQQGSLRIEADRIEVIARAGRAERIRAWGQPVRVQSRSDAGEELEARAAHAVYQAAERRVLLQGNAEVRRNGDTIGGAVVHYALDERTFTAEGDANGRVTAVIQPAKREKTP